MKASLRNVSIQWDKKILGQSWCPPTFFSLTFFQKINSETQKGSSTKCFGTVRWNHFDAQSWRPPPFLSLIFFDFKKIWNTERSLYGNFRYYETKKVDGESWCPPTLFSLTFFDIKIISETQKGSSMKCFGTVSQKNWRGSWCPPPLFTSTFFKIKNFLKRRRVPLRNVSLLGNKHFRSTVVIPRPFLSSSFSPSGKLSETQKGSLTNSFGIVKQNSLT